jgi:hypothetical protein
MPAASGTDCCKCRIRWRSCRLLMEDTDYSVLFRRFAGVNPGEPVLYLRQMDCEKPLNARLRASEKGSLPTS